MADALFTFLPVEEYGGLSTANRLKYLSDAMEELERTKMPRGERGWHSLFARDPQADTAPHDVKAKPEG